MTQERMRKRPRQARAEATVDAIVEAAGQVLGSHGKEHATTTRIAERAGVSIGTLYQYFPGKEAAIAAWVERQLASERRLFEAVMSAGMDRPPREVLRTCCVELVRFMREDRQLYLHTLQQVPMIECLDELIAGLGRLASMAAGYLATRPEVDTSRDLRKPSLMAVHAMRAALVAVVLDSPDDLDDPKLPDVLADCGMSFVPLRG